MAKKGKIAPATSSAPWWSSATQTSGHELKKALVAPTFDRRAAARPPASGLQKLPRNASPVRLRNRDTMDGRPRGNLPGCSASSRVRFRDMAHRGELPGITKSSW